MSMKQQNNKDNKIIINYKLVLYIKSFNHFYFNDHINF